MYVNIRGKASAISLYDRDPSGCKAPKRDKASIKMSPLVISPEKSGLFLFVNNVP